MAPTTLAGVRAKLRRADTHIDQLDDALTMLAEHATASIRCREGAGANPNYPLQLAYQASDIPEIDDQVRTVVGDALFNLRSALDHLAAQLAIRDFPDPIDPSNPNVQFPICDQPKKQHLFKVIQDPDVLAALEEVQPYTKMFGITGDALWNDPLRALRELCNADKHRLLPVVVHRIDMNNLPWWEGRTDVKVWLNPRPLKTGDDVARFDFAGRPEVEPFEPHLQLAVTLDEGPPRINCLPRTEPVADLLKTLRYCITDDINTFLPFFPGEERIAQAGP